MKVVNLNAAKNNPLAQLQEVEALPKGAVPAGYIPIRLSTKGKVGAPELFHIKNFSTRTILDMALIDEKDLPFKLVPLLDDLLFEEDISVANFHEKEVIETLILLYMAFYSSTLYEVPFPYDQEDLEWLKTTYGEAQYTQKKQDLENGSWKPIVDIDLGTIETYDLDDSFKHMATITKKQTGFSASFRLPKFGDALLLKQWIDVAFGPRDREFEQLQQRLSFKQQLEADYKAGRLKDITKIPVISQTEIDAFKEYSREKAGALVEAIRGLHLCEVDGKDVSELPLSARAQIIHDDPRFDSTLGKKIDEFFSTIEFGIKSDVQVQNPITMAAVSRRFSFRLVDILQAIQLSPTDDYDIVFS
jgi:hypothetical protein